MRLRQGDMAQATVFNDDPAASRELRGRRLPVASRRRSRRRLRRQAMNAGAVDAILARVRFPVQLGGGIRDMATVEGWLGKGIARVIIGTAAVRDPAFVKAAAKAFPARWPSASTRAAAWSRWRAGPKRRRSPRSISAAASRTQAWRRSSTRTSRATACCRGSIRGHAVARGVVVHSGHRIRRARFDGGHPCAARAREPAHRRSDHGPRALRWAARCGGKRSRRSGRTSDRLVPPFRSFLNFVITGRASASTGSR